jgi:hypothetical protein
MEKENIQRKMKSIHTQIAKDLSWNNEQMKKHFDKKRVEAPSLREGDRVYLRRRTKGSNRDNIKTQKESTKYDSIFLGPFTVKRKMKFDNYELWLPEKMKIHPVFHVSLLKPTKNEATLTQQSLLYNK